MLADKISERITPFLCFVFNYSVFVDIDVDKWECPLFRSEQMFLF